MKAGANSLSDRFMVIRETPNCRAISILLGSLKPLGIPLESTWRLNPSNIW